LSIDWPALLRDYRKSRGLKQEAAARDFGVSQATISRWEAGGSLPPVRVRNALLKLARRERSPLDTVRWAETFKRVLAPGLVRTPDSVSVVTNRAARLFGVDPQAIEGLPMTDVHEGEVLEVMERVNQAGMFAGRVACHESMIRFELNRQIRGGVSFYLHYVSWPHFIDGDRVVNVSQGVVIDHQQAAEIRARLGGLCHLTMLD
jgi:transcriptional regulator with XRE-family HTH domain